MPDIRSQLKVLKRRVEQDEPAPKPRFNAGAALDRASLELAVHIPVGVAVAISCYGAQQYGAFAAAFVPMSFALSWLLSRTYAMAISTHRIDVALFLAVLGFGSFCWEAWWVHVGLDRFNQVNAAEGLPVFHDAALIGASVLLGLMNLFSRRAYVTGHGKLALDMANPEAWWKWRTRRQRGLSGLANSEAKDQRTRDLADDDAVRCYQRNGGWPLGYTPTPEALARVAG